MPWKFVMPSDVEGQRHREATLARIVGFWEQFAQAVPRIEAHLVGTEPWADLPAWMNERVHAIHPRLRWEFGQDLDGRYLVITCEGAHHLRPLTDTVVRRAPEIDGWSFREFRPSREPEEIPPLVRARTGHVMGTTTVQVKMGDHRRVDFVFQSLLGGNNEEAALQVARVAADYLIGEDVMHRWGGHLDVVGMSHALTASFVPLARVRSLVLELISQVLGVLPDRPYWKMPPLAPQEYKLRPQRQEEYGDQDDAMFGTTVIPELRQAGFAQGFCSCRFSRQGETFCYLKLEASDVGLDERYKRKKMIEEAMNAELRENGIGCVVGTATGRKYLYFDLAVVDVLKTLEATRRRLLALEVLPVRSWLMFYDSDLRGEYIGLRSATPRPPLWTEPVEQERERGERPVKVHASLREPTPEEGSLNNPSWMLDPLG